MEAVAWDLRWKIAVGLPVDQWGWNSSTLTAFAPGCCCRARSALRSRRRSSWRGSGAARRPAEQIVNSTPMLGADATQDTVRLVRSSAKKLIDAVAASDEDAARRLDDGLEFDYAKPGQEARLPLAGEARARADADPRRRGRGPRPARRGAGGWAARGGRRERGAFPPARSLGQDFEVDDDWVPRLHRGTRQHRIISTVNTEMRHGRKSQHQRFDGYKLSAAATKSTEALIAAVEVAPASEQDRPQAKNLIDTQPEAAARKRTVPAPRTRRLRLRGPRSGRPALPSLPEHLETVALVLLGG